MEEMHELRVEIATLNVSDTGKDDLIRFLDAIAISFIEQAFGFSAVQLSLSARANYAFNGGKTCANLLSSGIDGPVDLDDEGAINTLRPYKRGAKYLAT
ncbi:hypothetical protein [Sphingobium lignivorans]|uniref:Transposase n=1 Tax=Sphingobium lignivorans TaxID=2735886 RepID=A0ABR6NED3_9SPHN|nr:hypothetical protein [Sphingobium lignivorans]MBB5985634.1 hypothetical protein [Sphingobium lignivorans]